MTSCQFERNSCLVWSIENVSNTNNLTSGQIEYGAIIYVLSIEQNTESFVIYIRRGAAQMSLSRWYTFPTCVYIKGKDNKNHFVQHSPCVTLVQNPGGAKLWTAKREEIYNVILDNTMTVICMIGGSTAAFPDEAVKTLTSDKSVQAYTYISETFCRNSLSLDLNKLLKSEIKSDIVLQCGNSVISAHRSILSARSEVFAAMFRNGMQEEQTGIVTIEGVEETTLYQFLLFLYEGKLSNWPEVDAADLYVVADRYNVQSLKTECSNFIVANLTKEDSFEYLILADIFSDSELKRNVISFILQDENVLREDSWLLFWERHPLLALDVYKQHLYNSNDCIILEG